MLVSTDLISGRSMYQRGEVRAPLEEKLTDRNFGTPSHPFLRHFKVISFPDRLPSYPKHHRHRRQVSTNNAQPVKPIEPPEGAAASIELLNKLNAIHKLLGRSDSQSIGDKPTRAFGLDTGNLLDRVLSRLNEIKPPPKVANETGCDVHGSWLSQAAGGVFKIKPDANLVHKKAYDLFHVGFMIHKYWNLTASFPYPNNSQYLMLSGIDEREAIAGTFLAECRVCRGHELLQGNWLIVSHSLNCESMGVTGKLISDVWRRDTIDDMNPKPGKKWKKKPSLLDKLRRRTTAAANTGNRTSTTKAPTTKRFGLPPFRFKLH